MTDRSRSISGGECIGIKKTFFICGRPWLPPRVRLCACSAISSAHVLVGESRSVVDLRTGGVGEGGGDSQRCCLSEIQPPSHSAHSLATLSQLLVAVVRKGVGGGNASHRNRQHHLYCTESSSHDESFSLCRSQPLPDPPPGWPHPLGRTTPPPQAGPPSRPTLPSRPMDPPPPHMGCRARPSRWVSVHLSLALLGSFPSFLSPWHGKLGPKVGLMCFD